jgi:hypothetical protein
MAMPWDGLHKSVLSPRADHGKSKTQVKQGLLNHHVPALLTKTGFYRLFPGLWHCVRDARSGSSSQTGNPYFRKLVEYGKRG